jgi:NAD(P)-dependent dehydrogenase (short-subunit alcohol dehydrogenase family)
MNSLNQPNIESQKQKAPLRVLITGGTQGLGRALAEELLGRRHKVITFARHIEGVSRLREELPGVEAFVADISRKEDIYKIAGVAGEVDVLVNNASSLGPAPLRLLLDTDCEDFESVLQANLLGPFRLTKALAGNMLLRRNGLVVNITSDASVSAYPRWGAYSVAKAALDHLTRIWNAELASTGLRFVAVDPGDLRTAMHFAAVPDADPASLKDPALAAAQLADLIEGKNEKFNSAQERIRL